MAEVQGFAPIAAVMDRDPMAMLPPALLASIRLQRVLMQAELVYVRVG
jgi:hypothetical protein